MRQDFTKYTLDVGKDHFQNVVTGSTTQIDYTFDMDCAVGKAIQVSQPILACKHLYKSRTNSTPSGIDVVYPGFKDEPYCYNGSYINLPVTEAEPGYPNSYAAWDSIMHEYGHHVQNMLGISWIAMHEHYLDGNLANFIGNNGFSYLTKEIAIQNAWLEAWATIFGMVAQYKYYYNFDNIATVRDACYTIEDGYEFDIENVSNSTTKGEASEGAICAILWDLFDSDNDTNDKIALGEANWWNATTTNSPKTFSEFISNFYTMFPTRINDIAYNLRYYKMATSGFSANETVEITGTAPTFSWDADSGWNGHPYNRFTMIFKSSNGNNSITINNIYSTSYTISLTQWSQILAWNGDSFTVELLNYQTDSPTTGGYNSVRHTYSKPELTSYIKPDSTVEITGVRASLSDHLIIPVTLGGKFVTSIASNAFANQSIYTVLIHNNISAIGANAFSGCSNLTIYSERYSGGWNSNWNSSNRPFIWGCSLDESHSYVISFSKNAINPMNVTVSSIINEPIRDGYTFEGWYDNSNFSGNSVDIFDVSNGTTLYAKWYKPSSGGSCITTGSLITLADGTQTAVENLTGNEQLLVWDMLNGTFSSAPILFIDTDPTTTYDVIKLSFSDGTQVEVIDEHAFFDVTLNKYVFLRNDASQYIGHFFTKQNQMLTGTDTVQLVSVNITPMVTTAYSPVTYGHLCYYVNGMLSMPGNTESFINIFEVDPDTMAYDEDSMLQDIATYGLYTYEEFNNIIPIPELVFDAFNGQYLKVAIGKGITTLEEIQALLERYSVFFV